MQELFSQVWAMENSLLTRYAHIAMSKPSVILQEQDKILTRSKPYLVKSPGYENAVGKKIGKNGYVAIIPIMGVMSRYGNWCSWGTEDITNWVIEATNDEEISSIVFEINSPGGSASGIELLSTAIEQCEKPTVAFVAPNAYSGANWVAACCDKIMIESETISGMGSIGVYTIHENYKQWYEKNGIHIEMIRAEGSEMKARNNGIEELPADERVSIIKEVTDIRETFVSLVRKHRGNLDEQVFTGKTFNGRESVEIGLADEIGLLGDAIELADSLS